MLDELWRQVLLRFATELAVTDLVSGRRWTFAELDGAANAFSCPDQNVMFARGRGIEFLVTTLAAWKRGRVLCPLDADQDAPEVGELPRWCAHIKLTSATTSSAKMVLFRAGQLAADAANIVATMGLRRASPNLAVISMAHSYGFSNLVLPLLLHGIPLVLGGAPIPEVVRRASMEFSGLTLPAVPALWRVWAEAGVVSDRIRLAISAGAPLPLDLERRVFEEHGIKIHNFYGSSECGGIAYDRSNEPRQEGELAGSPLDNVSVEVSEGFLRIKSGAVGETYWPEPSAALAGGVFQTSDLAEFRNGCVYLRGRGGDQINIAGRKVQPERVEAALCGHPGVRECVVFGVPSAQADRGDRMVACVALASPLSTEELSAYLHERLPSWQVPREWWVVEDLGRNERGKISRAMWRRRFVEERG